MDVQPGEVRLVHLKRCKSNCTIEYAANRSLSEDVFGEGKIKSWDELQFVLIDMVQEGNLRGMAAAISLPANMVHMQHVEVPFNLPERQIPAEIVAQVQREFPGMTEELSADFILREPESKEYANLFYAAARKEYLMHYARCINSAGLQLKIADVDIYALQRIVVFNDTQTDKNTDAIIYLAANQILFILHQSDELFFHQRWNIPGNDFSAEIKHKIQLFLAGLKQLNVDQIILCSDDARLINVADYLKQAWKVPVRILNAMSKFEYTFEDIATCVSEDSSQYLLAAGLSLYKVPVW